MSMEQLVGLGEEKLSAEQRYKQTADSATNLLRQMYDDLRAQLENEVSFRTKNEEDLRNWFDAKIEILSSAQRREE